jgi:hypothetical protein
MIPWSDCLHGNVPYATCVVSVHASHNLSSFG